MQVIARGRAMGKTTELIKLAAEKFAYIICINKQEVDRVWHQAEQMGLDIPFPLTIDQLGSRDRSQQVNGYLVDNAELILQQIVGHRPLLAISISTNKEADNA
jgi:hypothetical protein